jgi:hypothetical protein
MSGITTGILASGSISGKAVGWVERSDTHRDANGHTLCSEVMGFARAQPILRAVMIPSRSVSAEGLVAGAKVILCEPGDIECEAILRRGTSWEWVADIVDGTIKKSISSE